jgi:hypothetical protein
MLMYVIIHFNCLLFLLDSNQDQNLSTNVGVSNIKFYGNAPSVISAMRGPLVAFCNRFEKCLTSSKGLLHEKHFA